MNKVINLNNFTILLDQFTWDFLQKDPNSLESVIGGSQNRFLVN